MAEMVAEISEALRTGLVDKLIRFFKSKGFEVRAARLDGYREPPVARNSHQFGDRKDKQADVYGYDPVEKVAVRGLVKVTKEELLSEHTKTQMQLFAAMTGAENNKRSRTYVIVPQALREDLNLILKDLNLLNKPHFIPLATRD